MSTSSPGSQSGAGRGAGERRRGLPPSGQRGGSVGELAFPAGVAAAPPLASAQLRREDRRKKTELDILEIPSIPNPFPELCCSQFTSVLSASLLPKANPRIKQVIKVYSEDETSRALEVPGDITARDLCQLLILKNHYVDDNSWTLFEHLTCLRLGDGKVCSAILDSITDITAEYKMMLNERIIEDHEMVVEIQSKWGIDEGNRFYFRKNYAKYEFFKNPEIFFPEHLVSFSNEMNGAMSHPQILQMFLSSSAYPEIHSYLHAKEQGKKSWKKMYFLLRRSGLYFSTKGTSKEPRHLQLFSEFSSSDVYMSLAGKKISGLPASFGFCFKPHKAGGARDLKQLYADSEQSRTCWMTAIRLLKEKLQTIMIARGGGEDFLYKGEDLFKYGTQLYQNYMQRYQGRSGCSSLNTPVRSASENSLVAMDFTGHKSRVIENPTEALSVAVEEGLAWRKKGCLRLGTHSSPATLQNVLPNIAIHSAQPWFHHKISRDEAHQLILRQGLVDGIFLVRDSQSNPKTFVLSLSHGLKIKHFQIVPLEEEGKVFYTLDDGHTRFSDLIQLVEFYQLNKSILPCKLKHYCARIAL